jgi:surfactin synthase thioesterase subunit
MLRLIGIHHAGGSAASLAPLRRHLAHAVDFRALELPGHGTRHREPLHTQRATLVEQLCNELEPDLQRPYALLGHSLGALLAYEIAQAFSARGVRAPSMLFVAGAPAPSMWPQRYARGPMSDEELKEEMLTRGGTAPELFDHPELIDMFLPVVRADFQVCEAAPRTDFMPLPCAVHVAAGLHDSPTIEQLAAWRRVTNREFSLSWYDGDHFFIRSHAPRWCAAIVARLADGDLVPSAAVRNAAIVQEVAS